MPSGFQQDQNQLSPDFYRVVITMTGGTATWNAASPANGAVNPYNWDSYTTLPSSDANGQRLARGNMRWQAIIEEVTKHADAQLIDVEVTSAGNTDANNVPTVISFTVKYDRDEFVLAGVTALATSFTPTTGGAVTIDTVAKALRYLVATGITRNNYARSYSVWDFTNQSGKQQYITINRPDTLANVLDDVAVQIIDGTELVSIV
jgi:hypothetical protein